VSVHKQAAAFWKKGLTDLQTSQSLHLFSIRADYFVDEVLLGANERKASDTIVFQCN
jgi:hypothetical protein